MTLIIIIISIIVWLYIGYKGFVAFWTLDFDLTRQDMIVALILSFLGAFAWFLYLLSLTYENNKVLVKKRSKK